MSVYCNCDTVGETVTEIRIRSMHTKSSQNNLILVHGTNQITQQVPELQNWHVLEIASTV
jgi:hypothetical protein